MTAGVRAAPVVRLALMLAAALAVAVGWPLAGVTLWIANRAVVVSNSGHRPASEAIADNRLTLSAASAAGLVLMTAAFAHATQAPAPMWALIAIGHAVTAWLWLSEPLERRAYGGQQGRGPVNVACEREATIAYMCWAGIPASVEPLGWVLVVMLGVSIVRYSWSSRTAHNLAEPTE